MVNRALQHALEAQRGLGIAAVLHRQHRHRFGDDVAQIIREPAHVGTAHPQHTGRGGIVQQRQQQMLHRHEFVAAFAGLLVALADGEFEVFAEHRNLPMRGRRTCAAMLPKWG